MQQRKITVSGPRLGRGLPSHSLPRLADNCTACLQSALSQLMLRRVSHPFVARGTTPAPSFRNAAS